MSELIGELDEGGSPLRIPEDWVAADHAGPSGPGSGVVAALLVSALSGAVVGGAVGFALGFLLG
jgi:hypothetical protein